MEIVIRVVDGQLQVTAKGVPDVVEAILEVVKVLRVAERKKLAPVVQPAPAGFLVGRNGAALAPVG